MALIEPIIRPPAEADSFLLQVTTGCSSNTCTFCGAYLGKPFHLKPLNEIYSDIEKGGKRYKNTRRVFLIDGDVLVVGNNVLVPILKKIHEVFPKTTRIASYANGYNITERSSEELKELYDNKLRLIYIGLESGNQEILSRCKKKSTANEMIEAVKKANDAQIKSSVIVLLGLGGKKYSNQHARDTIIALNKMQPRYLSFLSVMLVPGTSLYGQMKTGEFEELNAQELLRETRDIISGLELEKTIFRTNHASNYLPIEGRFPHDKGNFVTLIDDALSGKIDLRNEYMRGL
ncbi:MAG: radical SAM protein [Candidatus Ancaeobacter aquaticus]|nr:radical SAM protein [Candidatus Ancaeobacter aquaticus]